MPVHQEAKTIEAFERAVREHAFMGAQIPEAHEEIERHYHRAKAKLHALLGLDYRIPIDEEDED